jgi:hypothetical protein
VWSSSTSATYSGDFHKETTTFLILRFPSLFIYLNRRSGSSLCHSDTPR